jgi:hypothetical protein
MVPSSELEMVSSLCYTVKNNRPGTRYFFRFILHSIGFFATRCGILVSDWFLWNIFDPGFLMALLKRTKLTDKLKRLNRQRLEWQVRAATGIFFFLAFALKKTPVVVVVVVFGINATFVCWNWNFNSNLNAYSNLTSCSDLTARVEADCSISIRWSLDASAGNASVRVDSKPIPFEPSDLWAVVTDKAATNTIKVDVSRDEIKRFYFFRCAKILQFRFEIF